MKVRATYFHAVTVDETVTKPRICTHHCTRCGAYWSHQSISKECGIPYFSYCRTCDLAPPFQ